GHRHPVGAGDAGPHSDRRSGVEDRLRVINKTENVELSLVPKRPQVEGAVGTLSSIQLGTADRQYDRVITTMLGLRLSGQPHLSEASDPRWGETSIAPAVFEAGDIVGTVRKGTPVVRTAVPARAASVLLWALFGGFAVAGTLRVIPNHPILHKHLAVPDISTDPW